MAETDFTNPQSRVEKILAKAIQKYTGDLEDPQSRIEELLVALSSYIEQLAQGSGGGTPDWSVDDEIAEGYIKNKPPVRAGTGQDAVLEGEADAAGGMDSHAEGYKSSASGNYAHAEGYWSSASRVAAHAEGFSCTASGNNAHAEGTSTSGTGTASHAEGFHTVADGDYQHVSGKYNVADTAGSKGVYAEIVGNGTESARSNARTLDWEGNEWLAGKLTVGAAPADDMDVTTKKYVDGLVAEKSGGTPDWSVDDKSSAGFIKNKPPIFADSDGTSVYEGGADSASGKYSHAEGYMTSTEEAYAHAEGQETTASGQASHAEGYKCTVKIQANYAHAECPCGRKGNGSE